MAKRPNARRRGDARLRLVHGGRAEGAKRGTRVPGDAVQPLVLDLRKHLRSREPMDFFGLVSSFVAALDQPRGNRPAPGLSGFVESLIGVDLAETTAALTALAALAPDEDVVSEIRTELAQRTQPMPLWLRDIHDTEVTDAAIMGDLGGASDNIVLGYTWGDGTASSFVVHVDHDAGTVVRDAFTPGDSFAELMGRFNELLDDEPTAVTEPLDLGEARALLEEALANGDELGNDFESDSWPMCRPALEWLVSLMPEPDDLRLEDDPDLFKDWTDVVQSMVSERRPLLQDFTTSDSATVMGLALTGSGKDEAALGLIVAATATLTEEEFLGWTPRRVRELLEVLPTTFLVGSPVARRLPLVLETLAVWSLTRIGAAAKEITAVRDSVRLWGADYVAIATSPQAALLRDATREYEALVDQQIPGLPIIEVDGEDDLDEWFLDRLGAKVGGRQALLALDTVPLPAEDFDWSVVPDDVLTAVEQVLEPLDEFTGRVGGVEYQTACRRFLAAVVAGDANVFRRRASAAGSAGAIAWLLGRENHLVASGGGSMRAQDLWADFGVKGGSTRADTFRYATGVPWGDSLGRPDWLVSARRSALVRQRDDVLARIAAKHR
jgi:hypothetical protein